jgi:hypothetical protein
MTTPSTYTMVTVRCADGLVRHGEPFTSRRAAATWADQGHVCAAHHTTTVSRPVGIADYTTWLARWRRCCGLFDHNAEHVCGRDLYTGPLCDQEPWCLSPTVVAFYGAPGTGRTRTCRNGHSDTPPRILTPEEVR